MNKFYADSMLGKLARFLRFLGFDTLYRSKESVNDMLEDSQKDSRVLLSRSEQIISLCAKKNVQSLLISSMKIKEQLQTLKDELTISYIIPPEKMKCSVCNGDLTKRKKEEILDRIHEGTAKFYVDFWECNNCKKIYWHGSHWEDIKRIIEELE